MKLEQQVTSLELSKRLNELDVKQESYFFWQEQLSGGQSEVIHVDFSPADDDYLDYYAAFTVAELGEMLPAQIENGTWLTTNKSLNGWGGICISVVYQKWEHHEGAGQLLLKDVHEVHALPYRPNDPQTLTEADARAKMLIYLLENKLITLP